MNRTGIRRLTLADILLMAVVVAQAAGFLALGARPRGRLVARIVHDGRPVALLALDHDREFAVPGTGVTVEVRERRVRVAESDCPRKVCVRTGWVSRPGQTIVCVPNRLLVEVIGGDRGYDAETH